MLASSAFALDLTGTVRDFHLRGTPNGHPDFESVVSGLVTGLVSSTLDADGKPMFIGNPGDGYITSATTFAQWYRDLSGVNSTFAYTLNLTQNGSGIYEYSNGSFFPADGKGFNDVDFGGHNFGFTFELNTAFTYDASKSLNFNFQGDDDVWVYINGKLAVDLGGVHGTESSSVDLNSIASSYGLVDGHNYSLDLFFAERHTSGSSFAMQTNIELVPTSTLAPAALASFGTGLLGAVRRRRRAR